MCATTCLRCTESVLCLLLNVEKAQGTIFMPTPLGTRVLGMWAPADDKRNDRETRVPSALCFVTKSVNVPFSREWADRDS